MRKHFFSVELTKYWHGAQTGCGDAQALSGHGTGQLGLAGPAQAEGLDKMNSRGPFPPASLCDAVLVKSSVVRMPFTRSQEWL